MAGVPSFASYAVAVAVEVKDVWPNDAKRPANIVRPIAAAAGAVVVANINAKTYTLVRWMAGQRPCSCGPFGPSRQRCCGYGPVAPRGQRECYASSERHAEREREQNQMPGLEGYRHRITLGVGRTAATLPRSRDKRERVYVEVTILSSVAARYGA